jgi:hypothetical protein
MRLQNGKMPPPDNAGDGLPIERLGNRLDAPFISPNLSARRAAVLTQGASARVLRVFSQAHLRLGERPVFEVLRDPSRLVVGGVNARF